MIYTVTLNPSIDYIVTVENWKAGKVNRTSRELVYPGGKGINVSLVLKNLGIESTALGFVAGFTGAELQRVLREWGCVTDFVLLEEGMSRINVKIRSCEGAQENGTREPKGGAEKLEDKTEKPGEEREGTEEETGNERYLVRETALEETEINGQGPAISDRELGKFYKKLDKLEKGDILVLAGSIPGSMPSSSYENIMEHLRDKEIKIIVDAAGELLLKVLKYHPFLIKPNHHELEEIFQVTIDGKEEIISYGRTLQEMGAGNVLVSMAGDGAILLAEDGNIYESPAPKGRAVNSVGAGDSMVAGFLAGYLEERDYRQALFMGIAAGSASAFSEGLATREEVEAILSTFTRG